MNKPGASFFYHDTKKTGVGWAHQKAAVGQRGVSEYG